MLRFNLIAFLFTIGFIAVRVIGDGEVPVLIWGTGLDLIKHKPYALDKLSAGEFYDYYLKNLISFSPPVVTVFIEESLSSEDFRWRDFNNENEYAALQHVAEKENLKFIPYVNNPLKALKRLKDDDYKIRVYEKGSKKEDEQIIQTEKVYNDSNNVFMINLFDALSTEDRPNMLKRHGQYIDAICKQMQEKYGNVICILTATQPSWIEPDSVPTMRKLLSVGGTNDSDLNLYFVSKFGMIYTKSPPVLHINSINTTYSLKFNITMDKPTVDKYTMRVTFLGADDPIKVDFNFNVFENMWTLPTVEIIKGTTKYNFTASSYIGTSNGFSFHTPVPVVYKGDDGTLTFSNLQAEIFFDKDIRSFSVADDTVPFFSIPILMGLFISFLLLTIITIGLWMMFDIKTMDQFDDPKGKTITINATE